MRRLQLVLVGLFTVSVVGAVLPSVDSGWWFPVSFVLVGVAIGFTTTVADVGLGRTVQALVPRRLWPQGTSPTVRPPQERG